MGGERGSVVVIVVVRGVVGRSMGEIDIYEVFFFFVIRNLIMRGVNFFFFVYCLLVELWIW